MVFMPALSKFIDFQAKTSTEVKQMLSRSKTRIGFTFLLMRGKAGQPRIRFTKPKPVSRTRWGH